MVRKIEMKIIKGPYAAYVSQTGNRGITGIVAIETSHVAIHIWDEKTPALVQFDVYSCASFSTHEVILHLAPMNPTKIEHLFIDRADNFEISKTQKWLLDNQKEGA